MDIPWMNAFQDFAILLELVLFVKSCCPCHAISRRVVNACATIVTMREDRRSWTRRSIMS